MRPEIEWEPNAAADYVACCYGPEGDQPGDCYTRLGQDEDGQWWVDDGDDTVRCDTYGPFATREEAREAAEALAASQDEADADEDAEAMLDRMRTETAGEPDPQGEWCVYWETVGDDARVVERYETELQAEARAAQLDAALNERHPGGNLLCGYAVRQLLDVLTPRWRSLR
jgi:hypothetical protein